MVIAYIGNFEPEFSTENDVRRAFEFLGHKIIKLQENATNPFEIQRAALNSDMLLITGTWDHLYPLEEMINIFYECARVGIPTATLHLDTFWGKARGGRAWWQHPMFHTAYIFTADGDYQEEWKAFGKNHVWLPPAVRHNAAHFGKFKKEYECDVAFVGSNGVGYHEDVWGYRKELVYQLRNMCKRNGWKFKNPGGQDPKINRGEDMNDFYASAKVTVGDSLCLKKEDSQYWSDRVPEATGRGGHLIMPKIKALQNIYGGTIAFYEWGDFEGLEDRIKFELKNVGMREEAQRLAQKITADGHTYVDRVKTILQTVGLNG